MGASAEGYTVHKIFGHAGEMIADGEGAFMASYIVERSNVLARCDTEGVDMYVTQAAQWKSCR